MVPVGSFRSPVEFPDGELGDAHSFCEDDGRVPRLTISRVICPWNPGSMKPAVWWTVRPRRPRLDLPPTWAACCGPRWMVSRVDASQSSPGKITLAGASVTVSYSIVGSFGVTGLLSLPAARILLSSVTSMLAGWMSVSAGSGPRTVIWWLLIASRIPRSLSIILSVFLSRRGGRPPLVLGLLLPRRGGLGDLQVGVH